MLYTTHKNRVAIDKMKFYGSMSNNVGDNLNQ